MKAATPHAGEILPPPISLAKPHLAASAFLKASESEAQH